jgi:hypothetical protein
VRILQELLATLALEHLIDDALDGVVDLHLVLVG